MGKGGESWLGLFGKGEGLLWMDVVELEQFRRCDKYEY